MVKSVAIIGAGVSGLVSIKACLEEGLEPTCFEQQDEIGGLWYYTEDIKQNDAVNIYNSLISNTSKEMTCFSDFPFPPEAPLYLPHKRAHEYLLSYGEHFDLRKHILFKTKMEEIRKADDYKTTGRWIVDVVDGRGHKTSRTFDAVIICTGISHKEFIPSIKGLDTFKGTISHSNRFKDGSIYKNKRVVVVGNSHSAGDVACDVSRYASKIYLSIGDGCWLVRRLDTGGYPMDMNPTRFLLHLPKIFIRQFVKKKANAIIDHVNFGLQPKLEPFEAATMLNDELPSRLASGLVTVVSRITEINGRDLVLSDGTVLSDIDCVIFATGYKPNADLEKYHRMSVSDDIDGLELFKMTFPIGSQHNTLAFVGMVATPGGTNWTPFDLQARLIARVFAGKHKLPNTKVMLDDAARLKAFTRIGHTGISRVQNLELRDSIADELGVKPSFWNLFFKNPRLALSCYFGPSISVQYRIVGPHAWKGVVQACKNSYDNILRGTKHRLVERQHSGVKYMVISVLCIIGAFLWAVLSCV